MNLGLPYKGSKNTIAGATKKTSKEKLYFNGTPDEYRALMGADYAQKVEQTALF